MKIKKSPRGFTLIELLVVIAIIGLLSSIILASLSSARNQAKQASVQEEVNQLRSSLELSRNSNNTYNVTTAAITTNDALATAFTDPVNGSSATNIANSIAAIFGGVWANNPSLITGSSDLVVLTNNASSPTTYAIYATFGTIGGNTGYFCADSTGKTLVQNTSISLFTFEGTQVNSQGCI